MIVNKAIETYIFDNATPEDEILAELNRETHLKIINPRMLSGHPQGLLLELISKLHAPKNILEIGTYTGYSAICLAKGLQLGGTLHTIERDDELSTIQNKYFSKAGLENQIKQYIGDALSIIPKLNFSFDLVFIDADKKEYPQYFELIINKLKPGGIILADNVLWDGKVLEAKSELDAETTAIKKFNKTMSTDPRVETIILPIRDGISIIRKK